MQCDTHKRHLPPQSCFLLTQVISCPFGAGYICIVKFETDILFIHYTIYFMTHKVHMKDLHFDNRIWSNEVRFFKDEIAIFESRLGELVTKNTDKEMLAELEHFQNQFIRQNEVADETLHALHQADAGLAKFAEDHPIANDRVLMDDHSNMRETMQSFRDRYNGLKADFQKFSAKWM